MSSIFLSYKRDADTVRADKVRAKLESLGVDVFQDIDMSSGGNFSTIIDEKIKSAAAVLVLWTSASVKSRWVRSEANKGIEREALIAASFDQISQKTLPMPFDTVHTPIFPIGSKRGQRRAIRAGAAF